MTMVLLNQRLVIKETVAENCFRLEKIPSTQNQSFTSFIMSINIEFESIIMVNLNGRLIDIRFSLKTLVSELFSGAIIYLVYPNTMVQGAARSWCHEDSFEATGEVQISNGGKFITLPRPKSQGEHDWYFDLFHNHRDIDGSDRYWLDISEFKPATNPRKWVYTDGTPVSWTNWRDGEPNDHGDDGEPFVEVDHERLWNDVKDTTERQFLCVYQLPVGASKTCNWLSDYDDSYR